MVTKRFLEAGFNPEDPRFYQYKFLQMSQEDYDKYQTEYWKDQFKQNGTEDTIRAELQA